MAKVRGIEHFKEFFSEVDEEYVIIGGTAASILMGDAGLGFRSTKDIDLVILSHPADQIAIKIIECVKLADYQVRQSSVGKPRYYRFFNPKSLEFPHMLEIFAANSAGLELNTDQHIIPVQSDESFQLSAILLDDEYFYLLKTNAMLSNDGFRIINHLGNICMKAKAFREMTERKMEGLPVDSSDLEKHRNDVLKLALTLKDTDSLPLRGMPLEDMKTVMIALSKLTSEQVSGILREYGGQNLELILKRLKKVFRAPDFLA